jgi:hypothetical protein
MDETSNLGAWAIVCAGTASCVSFAMTWALGARRRSLPNRHLTGRPAAPYWHSPTGLQDERGIVPINERGAL